MKQIVINIHNLVDNLTITDSKYGHQELEDKIKETLNNAVKSAINNANEDFPSKDIFQNVPLKMILMPTGKKPLLPIRKSVQSVGPDGKTQTKQIYDAHDLSTRIYRAYYKFCIGVKIGRKSRKLLLKYGLLQYSVVLPIHQE